MNERIQQLVIEAFFDESTNGAGQKMYTLGEEKMQKFAELIVQDVLNICHDIARPQSNGDDHKFTPGAKAVDKLVRKFYGVEE